MPPAAVLPLPLPGVLPAGAAVGAATGAAEMVVTEVTSGLNCRR